jgi:UDP-2,3-diacylglucosamine pyrophosphatase LpxH
VLAVISDLHFQHTSHDALRYVVGGEVRQLEVHRNVTPEAFHRFFAQIHALVDHRHSRDVELVFAGDIFELHRTPLWFFDGSGARPSDLEIGEDRDGNSLRDVVHRILDHVVHDNAGCWPAIERFVRKGEYEFQGLAAKLPDGVKVRTRFLPGNHDRLVNAWPSVRARVRKLLEVEAPGGDAGAPFPHVLDYPRGADGSGYGVRIRHGHEYDAWNFPAEVAEGKALAVPADVYLRPCLGDYLTCDVATRMATCFRARYARALRAGGAQGEALRWLFIALTEFDDVRPFSLLLTYMAREFGQSDHETFEALRPVLRDAIEAAERHPFVLAEAKRLGVPSMKRLVAGWALKTVPFEILRALMGLSGTAAQFNLDAEVPPAELARLEPVLADGSVETVVAGHTHLPDQVPLPGDTPAAERQEGRFFLDTGTWRTTIRKGAGGCFGRVRAFTMVFAYDAPERRVATQEPDLVEGRRFETWTGHLASGKLGPAVRSLGKLPPPVQWLWLRELEVVRVQREWGGAEVTVNVGVDMEERSVEREGVKPGDVIDLSAVPPVPLHAALDGELWMHGEEVDTLTPNDPLPWALRPLARGDGRRFQEGPGELRVSDSSAELVLRYEVKGEG